MLSVIMLTAECHYGECHYAECRSHHLLTTKNDKSRQTEGNDEPVDGKTFTQRQKPNVWTKKYYNNQA